MTSTCLLVLFLTSMAAGQDRLDDYKTGGTDGEPSTPGHNLPYGRVCRPSRSPTSDCDVNLNVLCNKADADGTPSRDPTASPTEEGLCGCTSQGRRTTTHYEGLLDYMCLFDDLDDLTDPDYWEQYQTQTHGEKCGYVPPPREDILACEEGLYCNFARGKVCTCPKHMPIRDIETDTCEGKGPDDGASPCVPADNDCARNTHCDAGGRCVCNPGHGDWLSSPDSRCRGVTNGGACERPEDCWFESKLVCDTTSKTCVCPHALHFFDAATHKCLSYIGGPCTADTDCEDKGATVKCLGVRPNMMCMCPPGEKYDTVGKKCAAPAKFGAPCVESVGCTPSSVKCIMTATPHVCGCAGPSEEHVNGVCRLKAQATHDQACTKEGENICQRLLCRDDCVTAHGLTCVGGKCKCAAGKTWSQHICRDTPKVTSCTVDTLATTCHVARPRNMICTDEGKCACPPKMDYSLPGQACKLVEEQECVAAVPVGGTWPGDIVCLSDKCTPEGKCDCPPVNGVKRTYSSGAAKCVTDFYHLPCNPEAGDDGCHPAEYVAPPAPPKPRTMDMTKEGLKCVKKDTAAGRCECHRDLTYFQGYCIPATKSYDEVCDPTGNKPTCNFKAPFFLVCIPYSFGGPKCGCSGKAVIKDDKPLFIERLWDDAAKGCMLRANGRACKMSEECQSDHCKDKVCAVSPHSVPNGGPCKSDEECQSDRCKDKVCAVKLHSVTNGGECEKNEECQSDQCLDKVCAVQPGSVPEGEPCETNIVCVTKYCKDKKCAKNGAGTQIAGISALVIAAVFIALLH